MKFDLHVHSYYSDGLYSPRKIIDYAIEAGLRGIAITDHDSVLGIEEAMVYSKRIDNFHVIPGIEFSCVYDNDEIHILGYFIDYNNPDILSMTRDLRDHRKNRVKGIIDKLKNFNIQVDIEKVEGDSKSDFTGRVAIARELINAGYTSSIQEAFNKYLNPGRPAYVERFKLSVGDAISLIKGAGGIPILAHPGLLKDKYLIQYCIEEGIEGIESVHSKHSPKQTRNFKALAERNNLISTGGSDCHGEINNGELLLGKYFVDLDLIPKMKERIR